MAATWLASCNECGWAFAVKENWHWAKTEGEAHVTATGHDTGLHRFDNLDVDIELLVAAGKDAK